MFNTVFIQQPSNITTRYYGIQDSARYHLVRKKGPRKKKKKKKKIT
jgi:hypothetical protein